MTGSKNHLQIFSILFTGRLSIFATSATSMQSRAGVSAKIFETEMSRDIEVTRPTLQGKSRNETEFFETTRLQMSRIFLELNFGLSEKFLNTLQYTVPGSESIN